jgi:hypothetical protein
MEFDWSKHVDPIMSITSSKGKVLVKIRNDGTVEYDPNYTPDEAARIFWEAMGRKFKESEV